MRRGVSMIEVVIAFLVLGLAMLPILQVFSSTGRQAAQTGEYELSITLEERIAEGLRLANWEDTHLLDELASDPASGTARSIVDGQSPYFRALEDDQAPFGRLLEASDSPINPAAGPLYTRLREFSVASSSTPRPLATTGAVADYHLDVNWVGADRTPRRTESYGTLARHAGAHATPELLRDRRDADARIVQLFYPERTGTLDAIAGAAGADLAVIRVMGDIAILTTGLLDGDAAVEADIAAILSGGGATPFERARAAMIAARRTESRAAAYLQAIQYLVPAFRGLTGAPSRARLGNPPPTVNAWWTATVRLVELATAFDVWATRALEAYVHAYNAPLGDALPARVRVRALVKALELAKLRTLTTGPADVSFVRALLTGFMQYEEGRRTNFYDYAKTELSQAQSVADLEGAYPAPDRFQAFREFQTAAPAAATWLFNQESAP